MRVLHLLDDSADWEQRVAVNQLLDRLSPDAVVQSIGSTDPRAPRRDWFNDTPVDTFPVRLDIPFTAALPLRRFIESKRIDTIHAWGVCAAIAAAAARPPAVHLVVQRFDPHLTPSEAKSLRTLAESPRFAIACTATTVHRRLVETGLPGAVCVVIRPGVDFRRINAAKKDRTLRARLGLDSGDYVSLAAHPVTRHGGHDRALWAGFLRRYLEPSHKMVIFGDSPECHRLQRLSRFMPREHSIIWSDGDTRYEEIIAIADCLVVTPMEDVSTTSIAWAMAANVPVVGSAVYAVAELIAHKHNGLLLKPDDSPPMTMKITAAINKTHTLTNEKEVARGQAFEVFSVRRFADQTLQLYQNLLDGAPVARDITDSAVEC